MKIKLLLTLTAAFVGLWGITWCLPQKSRVLQVLPGTTDNPEFRKSLLRSWQQLHGHLGKDIIASPDVFSWGFEDRAVVEPGWSTPPEQLLNSARSFHVRSAYEDEANILRGVATLKPHRLELNPRVYWYGNSYIFLLAAWIGASSLISPVTLVPGLGYYLEHIDKMAAIFLSGRLLSAVIFWMGGFLLYAIGKRHFNERAGLIAAGLYLVSPALAYQAHFMKPHLLGNVFILVSFSLCADMLKTGDTRRGILAGAVIGLAGAAAIHLSIAVVIVAAAFGLRLYAGADAKAEFRWVAASALSFFAAFLITNSYFLTEFTTAMNAIGHVSDAVIIQPLKILKFFFLGLPLALTTPIFLCFVFGLTARVNRAPAPGKLALISVSALLASSILFHTVGAFDSIRYFGGALIGFLLAGAALSAAGPSAKAFAAFAFLYGLTATSVVNYNLHLDATHRSTKDRAGAWIEREIPAGEELCLLRLPQPSNAPYFQWNRYRLRFIKPQTLKTLDAESLPEYIVLTHASGDDGPYFAPVSEHYRLVKAFKPFSLGWIDFPIGQVQGNALIEIFKRSHPRSKTAAAKRITHGIAEIL